MYEHHYYKSDWEEPAYRQAGLTGSSRRLKNKEKREIWNNKFKKMKTKKYLHFKSVLLSISTISIKINERLVWLRILEHYYPELE